MGRGVPNKRGGGGGGETLGKVKLAEGWRWGIGISGEGGIVMK